MAVKWINDEQAVAQLARIGIKCTERTISAKDINRKLSAENRARKVFLDESRIDGIQASIRNGIPLPKIVVRETASDGYVVAGGNHRLNSIGNEPKLDVHVINCTDTEFELAVRLVNLYVGDGQKKSERIEYAVDAINRSGLTVRQACMEFGVTKGEIQTYISDQKSRALLDSVNVKGAASRLTKSHVHALGELANNPNVLRAAVQAAMDRKMTTMELNDLAKVARQQRTEAAQVRVFEAMSEVADPPETVVQRKIKKKFLSVLSQLRGLSGSTTWSSLEITENEIEPLKGQVKEVRDMLNCLLKADG